MNSLSKTALKIALPAAAVLAFAAPAFAHHAFNMFALDQVVTVTGTVKTYDFKMPHVWIYIVANTPKGQEDWGFEAHSPNLVARKGWNMTTLKPGDKVSLRMHPMKDGSKAGSLIDMTLADGRNLWNAQSLNQP